MIQSAGVVALLFTDLVGSTELLDRLGDEAADELRRTHFRLLRQAVSEAGGQEVKSLGDGLMVVFASPVKAVGCSVAIQRAVDDHNRRQPEQRLLVRVGLHAGEPMQEDDDFFGSAVVVARRLCEQAEGGQILTSDLVAGLVGSRGGFRFRPAGRLRLKGLTGTLPAVAVEWEPPGRAHALPGGPVSVARPPPSPGPLGPTMVGRARELHMLEAELARAVTGEFRAVLVLGEPGVGKTRLMNELLARRSKETIGLASRAYPLGDTTSFGLWCQAVERHLRGLPASEVSLLCGGFLDDLAALLRSVAAVRGSAPEREPSGHRLLEGLAVILANLASQAPVLVILDDIHLADASSCEALAYLGRNLSDAPLLVLAAARPAELADHPLATQVLLGLEQENLLSRLHLDPLDLDAVGELAEVVLGQQPPPALVDWLAERSRGNALFALGLIQALMDEGADLAAPRLRRLPEGLADRVSSRIKLFDEPALATLELLALLGRPVEASDLVDLTGQPLERLAAILERLVRSRLVLEQERGREVNHEVAHPLIQEAICQSIGAARRRTVHRLLGRALLATGRLGEAASHYARSASVGDSEAIEALRVAMRQAEERHTYREALGILGTLVELLPPGDGRWLELLDAMSRQGEWVVDHRVDVGTLTGIIGALRAVDTVLEGSPDPVRQATVKFRLASFLCWGTGELEEAERVSSQSLELLRRVGDEPRTLLATLQLAAIRGLRGDLIAWEKGGRRVLEAAQAAGARSVTMQALTTAGFGALFRGRFKQAEEAFRRSMVMAREEGNPPRFTVSAGILTSCLAFEGRVEEALLLLEEPKRVDRTWRESTLLEWETVVHWLSGDFRAALVSAQEAVASNPEGFSKRRAFAMAFAALSAAETDDLTKARTYLARAQWAYGDRDWFFFRAWCQWVEGVLAWREGRLSESFALLRRAAVQVLGMHAWPFAAPVLLDLAEVAGESEEVRAGRRASDRLDRIARSVDRDLYYGLAAIGRSSSNLASRATERAVAVAREAVELLSGTGCQAFLGRALDLLGRSLSDSDAAGAREAFERAATTFEACGAVYRRRRALDALPGLGTAIGAGRGMRFPSHCQLLSTKERP